MSLSNPSLEDKVRAVSAYDMARLLNEAFGGGLKPTEKANEHNIPVVAATDILAAVIAPTTPPCLFRVAVAFDAAGLFSVQHAKGGVTVATNFNAGGNLTPNALYFFDMLVHSGDTVNFQYSVNATLLVLRVQEINGGTQ